MTTFELILKNDHSKKIVKLLDGTIKKVSTYEAYQIVEVRKEGHYVSKSEFKNSKNKIEEVVEITPTTPKIHGLKSKERKKGRS